ncbi:MAG: carboxylesterase/lipase family protein [Bacteroidales bacterium]|nr:carboxylesterase/lipase family protein [Bacteroidales bacterium]
MKTIRLSAIVAMLAAAGLAISCANNASSGAQAEEFRPITAGENTRVNTTYGTVEGYLDGTIYTFKGIQYAKAERFMPPQDPDMYEGVRMCKIYGPQAPQSENLRWNYESTQSDYAFGNNFVIEPMDEKGCQVLNVWTPGLDNKKRPVFVWVHGGGYSGGSAHDLPCYEGYSLAKKGDIVFVNLNHRLNVLGYVDLSGLGGKWSESVNLGQQDIVKALEWIHKNIEKFGGDPNQVTVGGQSGGGGKVSNLLAMPSAKGLFHRATVQSGSGLGTGNKEVSQKLGLAFIAELGLTPATADRLKDFSYEELVEAGNRASRKLAEESGSANRRMFGFAPTEDGKIITCQPFGPDAPEVSRDVPMLIGTNFNEFAFNMRSDLTRDEVVKALSEKMGQEKAARFVAAFEKAYPGADPNDMLYIDTGARWRATQQAASKSRQGGAPAYLYMFNWRPKVNTLGASHGMELPFMFNNVSLEREMTGAQPRAYAFQEKVADAWLSFIKTGKPAAKGLPEWKAYDDENGYTMILDDESRLGSHFDRELMQIMN